MKIQLLGAVTALGVAVASPCLAGQDLSYCARVSLAYPEGGMPAYDPSKPNVGAFSNYYSNCIVRNSYILGHSGDPVESIAEAVATQCSEESRFYVSTLEDIGPKGQRMSFEQIEAFAHKISVNDARERIIQGRALHCWEKLGGPALSNR
jgi:hypothetical protein